MTPRGWWGATSATLCAFCVASQPAYRYPTADFFVLADAKPVHLGGGWWVCAECSVLVEAGAYEVLAFQAALIITGYRLGDPEFDYFYQACRSTFAAFAANRCGGPTRYVRKQKR